MIESAPPPRLTVALSNVLEQLCRWQRAADLSRGHVLDPDAAPASRAADMYLFATALRQVLRFAELARSTAPRSARPAIKQALTVFKATSPGAVEVRDIIDHYDDYLRGAGNTRARRRETYQGGWVVPNRPSFMWTEDRDASYRLYVSPVPGPVIWLDVIRDSAAAQTLTAAIVAATRD